MSQARLGELLVRAGVLSEDNLRAALRAQQRSGDRLGLILARDQLVDPESAVAALASASGLPRLADLDDVTLQSEACERVAPEWAEKEGVAPLYIEDDILAVALTDPSNVGPLDELSFRTGKRVRAYLVKEAELAELLHRIFPDAKTGNGSPATVVGTPSTPPQERPSQVPSVPPEDAVLFETLKQINKTQDKVGQEIQALFELCVEKGLIERKEYLARLDKLS